MALIFISWEELLRFFDETLYTVVTSEEED